VVGGDWVNWLIGAAAIAAAAAALTVFGGWGAFLDVTGISETVRTAEIYRAVDEQCDSISAAYPDDAVGCQSQREFVHDFRRACAGDGPIPADHFLVGVPGTTRINPAVCP
jgi:hypothetical protein